MKPVLPIHQNRLRSPADQPGSFLFPAGRLDADKTPMMMLQAAESASAVRFRLEDSLKYF